MRTIINKIFFGAIFIFLSWKGLDGLTINVLYNSETSIDILQLEQSQELSSRNLEILNGLIGEDFVYYESDQYSPVDIVYPLMSYEQHEKLNKLEPILVRVLVRINNQSRNCLRDGNCIPIDSTSVKGIVKIGLENLRSSDFETLESDLLKLSENVILIEPNKEPIVWYWNLVMFLGGTVFGFAILKSFFRRASSLQEYWKKITEKDES
jgi:hypothetical protein